MNWLKDLLTGGLFSSIENVSKELIDTPLELAQAQAIKLKAIDPNGQLRRGISSTTNHLYKIYMYIMMFLLLSQAFELGNPEQIAKALSSMVDLFVPITAGWGTIMTATFGVNAVNANKGR